MAHTVQFAKLVHKVMSITTFCILEIPNDVKFCLHLTIHFYFALACTSSQFKCKNRNCIDEALQRCNGVDDCGDNSDEVEYYCSKNKKNLLVKHCE